MDLRKVLLIFILLLSLSSMRAETGSPCTFLSNNIISSIQKYHLTTSQNFFIDFKLRETNELNKILLQEALLHNSFIIVESEENADYTIGITSQEQMNKRFKETTFIVRFLRHSDSQVMGIERFVYTEKQRSQQDGSGSWYNPYVITFVLGSLVYLLFYGRS